MWSAWPAMSSAGTMWAAGMPFTNCMPHDSNSNAARSELLCADSTGNYIDCGHKLVALLGVKDLIIVDTPDALLVADRSRAQQVGDIVKLLEKNKREELL